MNLVQCGDKKPINKLRFPSLLNEKVFKNNFIQNLTYSEFEIPFKFKIDDDFLNPEKSILDSWIFESIPYQNGPFPDNQKHHIPCYSATKFSSGRASAMKKHIIPLIKKHEEKLFNPRLAYQVINQNYKFENDFDHEKISKTYFNKNTEIFWKTNLDKFITPWIRISEIINNNCNFSGPWMRAHDLKFRRKTIIHNEEVDKNIIDLLDCKAVTVLGSYTDKKVLNYCQYISPLHIVEEFRFDPIIKKNKLRL